jgi:LysM repeat protein
MENTAAEYGLKKDKAGDNNFDERRDPLKSAKAAARFLLKLYERMNHDWDLVLSSYNGGFAGKFKAETLETGEDLNYLNFLGFLEKKIEKIKKELSSAKTLTHEVIKKDETLEKIAKLYGLDEKNLALINKLKVGATPKVGDKIVIPPTLENRRKNFYYHIEGFSQNISYPAKLDAVLAVLEKRKKETGKDLLNQKSTLPNWKELDIRQEELYFRYDVKKGDTIFSLAKKFKIDAEEIFKKNNLDEKVKLKLGDELFIRNKKQPKTLASLARPGELELMKLLNPAIKNANEPLPSLETFPLGIPIRYPKN